VTNCLPTKFVYDSV